MILVDGWAAGAAAVAAIALGLRAEMLKPGLCAFHDSPAAVRLSLSALSIALGGRVVTLLGEGHAQAAEACVYTAQAITSVVMLWNLYRQIPHRRHRGA